ncbi:unnamed protein product [Vitrella brassicaformis CCMP3155]|uniref:Uncharacterized protein n=1 Tax=Vitrella brassicaformis (strain CCMP3155) TaxID=1169540 RepID=A0A0G4H3N3_VITBC|nr:unnamed protein product [Vitrella brassicaformis CCMP3155]|eukprot:CEM38084.1 unnamed protein product [Vitrella brassicaformis CCMP3155]
MSLDETIACVMVFTVNLFERGPLKAITQLRQDLRNGVDFADVVARSDKAEEEDEEVQRFLREIRRAKARVLGLMSAQESAGKATAGAVDVQGAPPDEPAAEQRASDLYRQVEEAKKGTDELSQQLSEVEEKLERQAAQAGEAASKQAEEH